LEVDTVLWAVGRVPNIKKLNLDSAGVKLNEKGYVVADPYQATTTEGIFALGDACGVAELTPGKLIINIALVVVVVIVTVCLVYVNI
jgi:glutathione reductase (NADPH)